MCEKFSSIQACVFASVWWFWRCWSHVFPRVLCLWMEPNEEVEHTNMSSSHVPTNAMIEAISVWQVILECTRLRTFLWEGCVPCVRVNVKSLTHWRQLWPQGCTFCNWYKHCVIGAYKAVRVASAKIGWSVLLLLCSCYFQQLWGARCDRHHWRKDYIHMRRHSHDDRDQTQTTSNSDTSVTEHHKLASADIQHVLNCRVPGHKDSFGRSQCQSTTVLSTVPVIRFRATQSQNKNSACASESDGPCIDKAK